MELVAIQLVFLDASSNTVGLSGGGLVELVAIQLVFLDA